MNQSRIRNTSIEPSFEGKDFIENSKTYIMIRVSSYPETYEKLEKALKTEINVLTKKFCKNLQENLKVDLFDVLIALIRSKRKYQQGQERFADILDES